MIASAHQSSTRMPMGDTIRLEPGAQPWSPGYGSELIEELARFDVPTVGLLEQQGTRHAFWCVEGWNDPKSLWAYILLEEGDVDPLLSIDNPQAGYEALADLVVSRPVTVALADEGEGIVLVASLGRIDTGGSRSVVDVARHVVEAAYWALDKHLDHLRHQVRQTHRRSDDPYAAV